MCLSQNRSSSRKLLKKLSKLLFSFPWHANSSTGSRKKLLAFRLFTHHKCWCALNTHIKHILPPRSFPKHKFSFRLMEIRRWSVFRFSPAQHKTFHEFSDWNNWRRRTKKQRTRIIKISRDMRTLLTRWRGWNEKMEYARKLRSRKSWTRHLYKIFSQRNQHRDHSSNHILPFCSTSKSFNSLESRCW